MDRQGRPSYNNNALSQSSVMPGPFWPVLRAPKRRGGLLDMSESSDRELLDLIRRRGPLTVVEMSALHGVTGTAVRNRLARLLATGMVERKAEHVGRGRPRHQYQASVEAHKRLGQNYADL